MALVQLFGDTPAPPPAPNPPIGGLQITATSAGLSVTPKATASGVALQYSIEEDVWESWVSGAVTTTGTTIAFRVTSSSPQGLFTARDETNRWVISKPCYLSGGLANLVGDLGAGLADFAFSCLFFNNDVLGITSDIDDFFGGWTVLPQESFSQILAQNPHFDQVPANWLASINTVDYHTFEQAFAYTGITGTIPDNICNASNVIGDGAYSEMFYHCQSITGVGNIIGPNFPVHPSFGAFYQMFCYCTALEYIPGNLINISGITLGNALFMQMFLGCTSLKVYRTSSGTHQRRFALPYTNDGYDNIAPWGAYSMFNGTTGDTMEYDDPVTNVNYYLVGDAAPEYILVVLVSNEVAYGLVSGEDTWTQFTPQGLGITSSAFRGATNNAPKMIAFDGDATEDIWVYVSENGGEWSHGEAQLTSLATAGWRHVKYVPLMNGFIAFTNTVGNPVPVFIPEDLSTVVPLSSPSEVGYILNVEIEDVYVELLYKETSGGTFAYWSYADVSSGSIVSWSTPSFFGFSYPLESILKVTNTASWASTWIPCHMITTNMITVFYNMGANSRNIILTSIWDLNPGTIQATGSYGKVMSNSLMYALMDQAGVTTVDCILGYSASDAGSSSITGVYYVVRFNITTGEPTDICVIFGETTSVIWAGGSNITILDTGITADSARRILYHDGINTYIAKLLVQDNYNDQGHIAAFMSDVTPIATSTVKFAVVCRLSAVAGYSYDGINWITSTLPSADYWSPIAYGNGKFVTVANYSSGSRNTAAYSEDGIHWTACTLSRSTYGWTVAYGGDKFVAVGLYSFTCYSEDGINWTNGDSLSAGNVQEIVYGDGKFVVIHGGTSATSNVIDYSTDGISWATSTLPVTTNWNIIAYGGGKFVTIAYNSDIAAYSTDGINWTETTMPFSGSWRAIAYGGGKFVAVTSSTDTMAYSEDGINWIESTLPVATFWIAVAYNVDKFVAVAYNSNIMAYSTDGINWTEGTMPSSTYWAGVAGNSDYVSGVLDTKFIGLGGTFN